MKYIQLTQGKYALVDDDDYDFLIQWKWSTKPHGTTFYALRGTTINGQRKTIYMHREIMKTQKSIDHISGDGLDNRKKNLRECDQFQNMANRKSVRGSSSKFLGVSWNKNTQKWRADIRKNGELKYLGLFPTEELAAQAYNQKAIELHGEFANLNS